MKIWNKAISMGLTATMLASLLATAAVSSTLAAVPVTSGAVDYSMSSDTVPADGASTIVLTFSATTGVGFITISTSAGTFTAETGSSFTIANSTTVVDASGTVADGDTITLKAPTSGTTVDGFITVQLTPSGGGSATTDSVTPVHFTAVTNPTVTINQAAGQADPTTTSPINFTVVFSQAVTGFSTGDVTIGGTAGGVKVGTVTGSGTTYNVAVTGMTTGGTVTASINAGVAAATSGGLLNQASTSTDNTVTWSSGPTVTINQAAGQADPTSASPINFTVVFSAPVTGFATGDVTITGTAGGTKVATVTGSGATYNVAVTGMTTAGTVIATIAGGVATATTGGLANAASTSTDNTVAWSGIPTSITLTNSARVITWGNGVVLTIQFGTGGANRSFTLEAARDGLTWATIATLTTNGGGNASLSYRPATNLYYRARFAGAADLAAGTSNTTRTVVRQIALLRPTNFGVIKSIARNTSITFTTTVRPSRPELSPAKVTFVFYRRIGGVWTRVTARNVYINSLGKASTTFKFTASGSWYVRSIANPTSFNANSVWSPLERYSVR